MHMYWQQQLVAKCKTSEQREKMWQINQTVLGLVSGESCIVSVKSDITHVTYDMISQFLTYNVRHIVDGFNIGLYSLLIG